MHPISTIRLTPRELEVAQLVRDGLADKEIAVRLRIGRRTAEWHLKQILNKLGFTSRTQIAAWVAESQPWAPDDHYPGPARNVLPAQLTTFVGREREVAEVKGLVARSRLVTLTAVGGIGKTRLAFEVAARIASEYADGIRLVDLAPINADGSVVRAFASAVRVHEQPRQVLADSLIGWLSDRRMLLVVDNCEHVVHKCAALVQAILQASEGVRVLATSRERLGIAGESVWQVPPLGMPDDGASVLEVISASEAVRLFSERACSAAPAFQLSSANAATVAALCSRLEGIPLAIELAAARAAVMTPAQILSRLEDRFSILASGPRSGPVRHHTLAETLDWSHDLLNDVEARLFRRLSIFAGGFSLEAAEFVCALENDTDPVHDVLNGLVDKSLVIAQIDDDGSIRFKMLDTVREYSRNRPTSVPERGDLAARHCDFFLARALEGASRVHSGLAHSSQLRLAQDINNFRAALRWSLEHRAVANARLNSALVNFWHFQGLVQEGDYWAEQAIAAYRPRDAIRAELLDAAGRISFWRADRDSTARRCRECLDIYSELGGGERSVLALDAVGEVSEWNGNFAEAHRRYEEALVAARTAEDSYSLQTTLRFLGRLAMVEGDHLQARTYLNESIALNERAGDRRSKHWSLGYLAINSLALGDLVTSRSYLEQTLEIARSLDLTIGVATSLMYWAAYEAAQSHHVRALHLAGAANAIARTAGAAPVRMTKPLVETWLSRARLSVGRREAAARDLEGQAMTKDQAVEYALRPARRRSGRRHKVVATH
jgi:predicted ATPase/DNA-binding CsgD family transcriptional regulator